MVHEKLYWVIFYRHDTFEIGKVVVTDVNSVSNDSVKILNQSFAKTTFRDGFFYLKKWGFYFAKNKVKVVPFLSSDVISIRPFNLSTIFFTVDKPNPVP